MTDIDQRIALYKDMLRIRLVEETIADRYTEYEMRCPVHLSIGQEAVAVGVCTALRRDDNVLSTHRSHAHYLAKGGDLNAMIAEIYGKQAGCCGGRGGSMHLFDNAVRVLASVPIVASSIPLGVGAALAARQRGHDTVSVIFIGDASIEEGAFHESANFAALKKLPVVFICENNLYSVYTGLADRQPQRPFSDVAKAHALDFDSADGNNVEDVLHCTKRAVEDARRGGGPKFLLFDTYRFREHCGPFFDNDLGYRSIAEFESWQKKCPVETFRHKLFADNALDGPREQQILDTLNSEIANAFNFAETAPFPPESSAGAFVYA